MAFIGTFQFRRDTAANWSSANPVLLAGELAIETDTDLFKLGDGTTAWNSLPYGGIKGDAGATGVTGPAGATGAAGTNGWSPVLSVEADGERRVLRLVDWVGGTGAKPAIGSYLSSTGFVATAAQATDIRGPQGAPGINALPINSFANVSIGTTPVATVLSADNATDTLTLTAGAGIRLSADAANDSFSIENVGVTSLTTSGGLSANTNATGAVSITNTGVTSLNGQTGAVTVNVARARIGPPTIANATTTAETIVARWVLPANFLVAGDSIRAVVMHQSGGTGTLTYRLRVGALGTTADALVAQLTTSAAQAARAQGRADFTVYFPSITTATGSGFAIQQAAVLGTPTAAGANVTVVPANIIHVSITITCSAASAANVTRGAWASVGN